MKCPVCQREDLLLPCVLEDDLPAYRCQQCSGIWISAVQYWDWLKRRPEMSAEPEGNGELPMSPVGAANKAKLCPECGHILRRYQVWPEVKFYLDRCNKCYSVWLDRDEWKVLRSRRLHDQIHRFFSEEWQNNLRAEESRRRMEMIYVERFGGEDYARLKEVRAWIERHPRRGAIMAYLSDRDPYQVLPRRVDRVEYTEDVEPDLPE